MMGELDERERIPTEKELAKTYEVSIITVRQAILNLVDEGFLHRKQGRGTFVMDWRSQMKNLMMLSVKADFGDVVPQWTAQEWKVIDINTMKIPNMLAKPLGMLPGQLVGRIRRTRSEEGVVISYIRHFLPQDIAKRIKNEDLLKYSMLDLLAKQLGMKLKRGIQHIKAISANHEIAEALSISVSSPVLLLESTIFDQENAPTQITQSFYRSDKFRYTMEIDFTKGQTGRLLESKLHAKL